MINRIKKNILSLVAIALFTVSCTQSKKINPTIIEGETAATSTDAAALDGGATIVASNPEAVVDGKQISAPAAGISGLNPEHGKPGHRCDIAVGAPLNSPVNNAAAPQTMPMPSAAPAPVANPNQPKQVVAAGMNPAHGEPGHRCDISVGAPLNSPVVAPVAAPQK